MTDTEIVNWLADNGIIEGFADQSSDIHEIVSELVDSVSHVTVQDVYRKALRVLIERAAKAQPQ